MGYGTMLLNKVMVVKGKFMRILFTSILIICFSSLLAQTVEMKNNTSEKKKEIKEQGHQEDYWAEQFFEKNYAKQIFERYKGYIVVTGGSFQYGNQTLIVTNTAEEMKKI